MCFASNQEWLRLLTADFRNWVLPDLHNMVQIFQNHVSSRQFDLFGQVRAGQKNTDVNQINYTETVM